jgi:hypothetical protein
MAGLGLGIDIPKFQAGQDLIGEYLFCTIKNGKVFTTKLGENSDGISLEEYQKNQTVLLRSFGTAKVVCGGNIADGELLSSDNNGCAAKAQMTHYIQGKALEPGTAGQIIEILLFTMPPYSLSGYVKDADLNTKIIAAMNVQAVKDALKNAIK